MVHPLHATESEPGRLRRAGRLKTIAQEEADRVGCHVRTAKCGEDEHPRHLGAQVRGPSVDKPDDPRERTTARLVDDREEDARWSAAHEEFDLRQDVVDVGEVDRVPAVEIGVGCALLRVLFCVEGGYEGRQFDAI